MYNLNFTSEVIPEKYQGKKKQKSVDLKVINTRKKRCHYCKSTSHLCRDCPVEKKDAESYKLIIGKWAENYVTKYSCPSCNKNTLKYLGDNSPSLDIICTDKECNHMIEVKSKCLSVKQLPKDIYMYHGNYNCYYKRFNEGLTFVFIIYSVNRRKKSFNIRKVYYVSNDEIKKNVIKVVKTRNNLSRIIVPNISSLKSWRIKPI